MATALDIKLGRVDKTYRPGDRVTGTVTLQASAPVAHNGLTVKASGVVRPQVEGRSGGLFDSGSASKPISLFESAIEMAPAGKVPPGVALPFEFVLEALPGRQLTETYHGVYVSVRYSVTVVLARSGFMAKPLDAEVEFVVEVPSSEKKPAAPLDFEIKPESLENVKKTSVGAIPKFLIKGRLNRTNCSLNSPFTGELTVEEAATRIKSLELQLVRVETIGSGSASAREATEIQNLQVGEGDVCRSLPIPLYMIFPRVFTCPSVVTDTFRVEFEVNIIVVFEEGYMTTVNFPIALYRAPATAGGKAAL